MYLVSLSPHLSEPPGFSFTLEKSQDISFPDRSLDIPDDRPVGFINELDPDLDK